MREASNRASWRKVQQLSPSPTFPQPPTPPPSRQFLSNDGSTLCRQVQLSLFQVPITQLRIRALNRDYTATVFGYDRRVFCPDYPAPRCGMWSNALSVCTKEDASAQGDEASSTTPLLTEAL